MRLSELKRHLGYLEKTNWLFERDTLDFGTGVPFEAEQQLPPSLGKGGHHHGGQQYAIGGVGSYRGAK
jgi:hypothetical protein